MTFTIVARSEDLQLTGIAMATSSPAVGNRCSFANPGAAVAFQSVAEPRLGAFGLKLMSMGYSAEKALKELVDSDPGRGSRQIGIIDEDGRTAVYTGEHNIDWAGHIEGDGFIAMGNVLAGPRVVEAIADGYLSSAGKPFEDRLICAIEAGRDAGGQEEGQASASILTFGRESYSRCDLRVDLHAEPIAELRRVYDWYEPLVPYFVERARNHEIGRFKDYLKKHGHHREFSTRPPVIR